MEHPSSGSSTAKAFGRCRPEHRCGVCRLLEQQPKREHALFRMILEQDAELLSILDKLSALFSDDAAAA